MAHLDLSPEESEVLTEYLETTVSALHSEIAHTSDRKYKDGLKAKRELLGKILRDLQAQA